MTVAQKKVKTPKVLDKKVRAKIIKEEGLEDVAKSNGKAKPVKTKVKTKKDATKKAVAKKSDSGVTVLHTTDRYVKKGDPASRTTQRRRDAEDYVTSGKATIGEVIENFGFSGMRVIAKHTRWGRYEVKGITADVEAKNDGDADKALANKLVNMDKATKIVEKTLPTQLAR